MRGALLVAIALTVPMGLFYLFRTVTGDPLSAVLLGLLLLITIGAWLAGRPADGGVIR